MLDERETDVPVDGRVARRERNIAAVLDVVIEMYSEDLFFPTIEQASKRSGLSLRSLYRYFADPGELHEAAIAQHRRKTNDVAHLPAIGEGPLEKRIQDFAAMRVQTYEVAAPVFRASVHSAGSNTRIAEGVAQARTGQRDQFERQFAVELNAMTSEVALHTLAAGDALTQFDSIDLLRRSHELTSEAIQATLCGALTALFAHAAG